MASLGRPFTLGMLYNGHRDQPIPGFALWDLTTIKNLTVENRQHSSGFHIISSDSTEEKLVRLGADSSLQASFMSGLIEVGGSANYLTDEKTSMLQSRVTFQYSVTTLFKQLMLSSLKDLPIQNLEDMSNGATHVVTGILFGANAFFVFDSEKLDAGEVQEVQDSMLAVIKKIPSFIVDGKLDVKLTDEEKCITDKFTCKFYGDFILQNIPVTFEDAVKTYAQLPRLLAQPGEVGVPMKIWMTPLSMFDPSITWLHPEVSASFLRPATEALQVLQQVLMESSNLLQEPAVRAFPQMQEKVRKFQSLCKDFRVEMKKVMAKKLLYMKSSTISLEEMLDIFELMNNLLSSSQSLSTWVKHMMREVNVVQSCIDIMQNAKLVSDQSELDRKVLDPGVTEVFCFMFTSLGKPDPFLKEMSEFFNNLLFFGKSKLTPPKKCQWYFSSEVVTAMRKKAKELRNIDIRYQMGRFEFFITTIDNEDQIGAAISHYRDGVLISDDDSQKKTKKKTG